MRLIINILIFFFLSLLNNNLNLALENAPLGMIISDFGLITWTALEGVLTSGEVTLTVSDGDLGAEETFTVTVAAVNDVPVITSTATLEAVEDEEYQYQISVEDPDNDSFDYTLSNAPEGMIVSAAGLITWTPTEGVLTSGLVTVTVSDGDITDEE